LSFSTTYSLGRPSSLGVTLLGGRDFARKAEVGPCGLEDVSHTEERSVEVSVDFETRCYPHFSAGINTE
jgi:hypothetical protein